MIRQEDKDINEYLTKKIDEQNGNSFLDGVSKRFRVSYRVDYRRFSVELGAENLNDAMIEFATYYHEIDEVYSIEKVNVC